MRVHYYKLVKKKLKSYNNNEQYKKENKAQNVDKQ